MNRDKRYGLTRIKHVNDIASGDRVVVLTLGYRHSEWKKSYTGVYEVADMDGQYVTLCRITSRGTRSKNRSVAHSLSLSYTSLEYGFVYFYEEHAFDSVKEFKEDWKEYRVSGRRRDTQRAKVYAAETRAWVKLERDGYDLVRRPTVDAMQSDLYRILLTDYIGVRVPSLRDRLTLERRRDGSRRGVYKNATDTIYLCESAHAMHLGYLVHEVAHGIARGDRHGPDFTRAYVDLQTEVDPVMGEYLLKEFVSGGVRIAEPLDISPVGEPETIVRVDFGFGQ